MDTESKNETEKDLKTEKPVTENNENQKTQNDGISKIADDLISNQSDVQPHAVQAEKEKIQKATEKAEGLTDRFGSFFDSKIHVTDSDGSPSTTKTGKLKRRPGRASGSSSIVGGIDNTKQGKQESDQQDTKGDPRQAAIHTVNMIETLGTMLAGDEWNFIKSDEYGIDERESGYTAFEQYYKSKDIGDFPPGIALAIWAIGYAAPRFTMPKTKSKFSKISDWFKIKFLTRRMKQPEDKGGEK